MKKTKDYKKLIKEIINLSIPFNIDIIGYLTYTSEVYPILKLENITKGRKYNIVIQAGIHGNESIGIRILIAWLRKFKPKWLRYFNFTIIPCMNPYGYVFNTRRNGQKQMVNSNYFWTKKIDIPELYIIAPHYHKNIDLFIDIHADVGRYGKSEIYAYERKSPEIASIVMPAFRENSKIISYIKGDTIYQEACKYGVIYNPMRDESIQDYMSDMGTDYAITLEIPGRMVGINRIVGSVKVINSILKYFLKTK